MGIIISLAYLLLNIAVIIFVAFAIIWLLKWFGVTIDPDVYKWGKIIVGPLIIIAILVWLAGVLGNFHMPLFFQPGRPL